METVRPLSPVHDMDMVSAPQACPGCGSSAWARCGVILAAGDGTRLRTMIRRLRGDLLPKQYVRFAGRPSMLEQTADRARTLIPDERLFVVASRSHLDFADARAQLHRFSPRQVVVQPVNKETGPGLLLPLMHLYRRYPESVVAVFPSDHFIEDDELFMDHVRLGFHLVEQNPSLILLLGVEPHGPEPDYGYILPGGLIERGYPSNPRAIAKFVEKPNARLADDLAAQGALWNTMVMIFRTRTLLQLVRGVAPELSGRFQSLLMALGTPDEGRVAERIYAGMPSMNLSRDLLEPMAALQPSPLAVLPMRGVAWSDWGSEGRIRASLSEAALAPPVVGAAASHPVTQS